ncbi:esterase [Erwinia sp. OLTSP20]|uniref:esterase n=1 Tax=unclassified Erwinia TaxID=2622719 RepID=UPI000C198030|nr:MULTISPECIES: esterase [unclassified Erwinia]PIJ51586.1 esterase [Erwinia sp. OAMSP11]PIJ68922.1 esterase [Erwinia sp. OLSSP12]PIJ83496.1 esterase [Erwinia sp. OLCASP19]PIJ83581.1 esterase [Erwinia sp. OLMDSP33]PIJ86329.1 esterase [Erwinia sp. OLMTSP26]
MKSEQIIVQRPAGPAVQLFLLFHGQGENPAGMASAIGDALAHSFPQGLVVSIGALRACGSGVGRQWYSTRGMTPAQRQQRVNDAMPSFIAAVRRWQHESGLGADATALIGFSQGSIMALEAVKQHDALAARVVAFSGRYAELPQQANQHTTIHLIHGDDDKQIPLIHAVDAQERLQALGGDITLDIIDDRSLQRALDHLHHTIPLRYFEQAMSGSTPGENDVVTFI